MIMSRIEYETLVKLMKNFKISRKSIGLDNDYFFAIDSECITEEEKKIIGRFTMEEEFNAINLNKTVVVLPKDIITYISNYESQKSDLHANIISISAIIISIISVFVSFLL